MPFDEPTRTEIDGVPLWYTDVPGPCMGGIVFRTGRADETLPTSGINHIVEHLALYPLWDPRLDMNGRVSVLTTEFVVAGTQEQTETFLASVCRNLRDLPLDRLADERQVLETEARSAGSSFAGAASARFGARGFGLVDWFEFGLRHVREDDVATWAAERFTTGQAAAWMTRPPGPRLHLELSPGPRVPIPVPDPIPGLRVPSHIHSWDIHVGCALTAKRSMPLLIAMTILRDRAMRRMRIDRPLTYTVQRFEERIGASDSMHFVVLDTTERQLPDTIETFTGLLDEIAGGEVTAEDVADAHRRTMPWNSSDPGRPAREAARKATASLFGREPTSWKGLKGQGKRLKPERVAAALDEALATAILVVPEGVEVPGRYSGHTEASREQERVRGRLYVRWDLNPSDEVVLSTHGVTRQLGQEFITMLFADVEVAARGPDGTITLIDRTGRVLTLEPNQLRMGKVLAETIAERLPGRVVDLRHDAIGWFELQALVESHDSTAIQHVWREIERLAQIREPEERILLIAFGSLGRRRGLVAVTDTRLLHIAIARTESVHDTPRDQIVSAEASTGVTGRRVRVTVTVGPELVLDRVRPRAQASQLANLLSPVG